MSIRLTVEMRSSSDGAEEFGRILSQIRQYVQEHESETTISYEVFGSGGTDFVVNEVYADGDGLLLHLRGLGKSGIGNVSFTVERMIVSGPISKEVQAALTQAGAKELAIYSTSVA